MTKVILTKLRDAATRKIGAKPPGVREKRVRGADGTTKKILMIDADSKTFTTDLTYVFGKNVAKARRENKRVTGAADRAPAKG